MGTFTVQQMRGGYKFNLKARNGQIIASSQIHHTMKDCLAAIDRMRAHSIRRVLATNPLFPACAVEARLRWAGLRPEDFSYITTYENSTYCKPNPAYFQEILEKTGLYAEQCIYIGNDAVEDLPARQLGIPTFLLTDNLICPDDRLLEYIPYGDYTKLERFMRSHMFA